MPQWISPAVTGTAMSSRKWRGRASSARCKWPAARSTWRERAQPRYGGDHRTAHVGYYLIDRGLSELEEAAQVRFSGAAAVRRWSRRHPVLVYLRLDCADHGAACRRPGCGGLGARCGRWIAGCAERGRAAGGQSIRSGGGELAGHPAGARPSAAAHGLLRGHSAAMRARWWWFRPCSPARATSRALIEALEVRFLANRDGQPALRPVDGFPRRR